MRRAWVGISAAAACAAMAAILLLAGNLEMLSWIAGAGSFIIAVPTLVLALTNHSGASGDSTIHPSRGTEAADSGQAHLPDTGTVARNPGTVMVELTTRRIRTANRLSHAAEGAGQGFAAIIVPVVVIGLFDSATRAAVHRSPMTFFLLAAGAAALVAFLAWLAAPGGKDLLIVNDEGLTIIDKRRIRYGDTSFTIPWPLLERVRLVSSTQAAFYILIVQFRNAESEFEASQVSTLEKRGDSTSDGHIMARLYVASAGTELLGRVRRALAEFGGHRYAE
ncbi:hypothetical protein ACFWMR_29830 [Amycolatopsis thailandensis]|uniref:hypothetical protein n=1 Tax=Amycolatopsis thailandensis TaxID=589330 RepID=UPI0036687390